MRKDLTEEIKKQAQRSMELEESRGLPPDGEAETMLHRDEPEDETKTNLQEAGLGKRIKTNLQMDKYDKEERMGMRYLIAIVFLLASFTVMRLCFEPVEYPEETKELQSESITTVTVIGKEDASGQDDQKHADPDETEDGTMEETEEEPFDWKLAVFGEKKLQVTSGTITVNGLTSVQKEIIHFRESDYVRQLAGFLKEKNLDSDEVHFQEKADISAETAVAYVAELNKDPEILISVFYPDYPGNYLFLLEEREEEEETVSAAEAPPAVWVPQNVPVSEQKQTEPAYDATRLSVRGIPNTLLNYLDNRYELQYSLYDYLYRNGYRDVTTAEVSDYSIDGEARKAEIVFTLSNGASLQGTYDKERNFYVYY